MSVTRRFFGTTADGREVTCYKITAESGMEAEILDYGATVRTLTVPDKKGNMVMLLWDMTPLRNTRKMTDI